MLKTRTLSGHSERQNWRNSNCLCLHNNQATAYVDCTMETQEYAASQGRGPEHHPGWVLTMTNPGEPPLKMGTRGHVPECWGQIVQPSTLNLMFIRGWVRQPCQPEAVSLRPNGNRRTETSERTSGRKHMLSRRYTELPVSGDNKKQVSFELV